MLDRCLVAALVVAGGQPRAWILVRQSRPHAVLRHHDPDVIEVRSAGIPFSLAVEHPAPCRTRRGGELGDDNRSVGRRGRVLSARLLLRSADQRSPSLSNDRAGYDEEDQNHLRVGEREGRVHDLLALHERREALRDLSISLATQTQAEGTRAGSDRRLGWLAAHLRENRRRNTKPILPAHTAPVSAPEAKPYR